MMNRSFVLLPLIVIAVLSTAEVIASSVGGGIYVPIKAVRTSDQCPTGNCRNGSTCGHCARLGFACVDGATEAPCTAEGGCYPKRPTFGHYEQKWRTWPGEVDPSGPTPTVSDEEESLLKAYDAPTAEEEDEQAPPPIEDSIDESGAEIPSAIPSVEIELPPLPRSAPERPVPQQPAPNFRQPNTQPAGGSPNVRQPLQRPPAPPFGLIGPAAPSKSPASMLPSEFSTVENSAESTNYASPAGYIPSAKESTMVKQRKTNSPPALPAGFAQGPAECSCHEEAKSIIRRLPVATPHRQDHLIQPVSANEPIAAFE